MHILYIIVFSNILIKNPKMNKIFLIFAGSYAKSKINRISNIFYKAFNTNNQRSMVMVRPVIFSKDNISLRIKPIKVFKI